MDEQLGDDASSPTSLAPVCARWTSSLAVASPSISTDEQIPVAPILRQRVPAAGCQLPAAKNRPTEFATSPWCCRATLLTLSWTGARDRELPVRYPRASPSGVRVLGTAHRRPDPAPRAPRPRTPSGHSLTLRPSG